MSLTESEYKSWDTAADFRARATFWVAIAALSFLLPVAILDILQSRVAIGIGSLGIVLFLGTNALIVKRGRCHQRLTLFGLVPAGMIFMLGVFAENGLIASFWYYPSIIACYCMLSAKRAWIANAIILVFSLPLIVTSLPMEYAYRLCLTLLATSVFSAILVQVIDRQQKRMHELLIHDYLTGLRNRVSLKGILQSALERYDEGGTRSYILAIDIDHFKRINDRHGHEFGDRALSQIAGLLKQNLRANDAAFRTGGEEFLVLLSDLDDESARGAARRLRQLTQQATIVPDESVTISVGLAGCDEASDWANWIKLADENLYKAKNQGRNRVVESADLKNQISSRRSDQRHVGDKKVAGY
ncbi:MAG: GGDEF domain-containing protein [Granulosicoccus sp.]|nr:GGDEF domain-containing protein [Granulosicoccus sp.]